MFRSIFGKFDVIQLEEKLLVSFYNTFTMFFITSHIHTHSHTHTYTCIHTHTHTHSHTYTHTHLQHLSSESLKQYCIEAVELLERQAGDSTGEERGLQVSSELEKLHKAILQCAGK